MIGSAIPGTITGVPHLLGLDGNQWFDYSVTTSAQVTNQSAAALSIPPLVANGTGNVCGPLPHVTVDLVVNPPVVITPALPCSAQQLSFSPTLQQEFVTGVDPGVAPNACAGEMVIHGYDVATQQAITLATNPANPPVIPLSGGVLSDGRKLFFGSFDGTKGAVLHRIDLATGLEDVVPPAIPASVSVVPNFVAVVPK